MINRKPGILVLFLIYFAISSIRLMAFQNCPDFKEFDKKVAKAIEVLEAEESKDPGNAILLEAIVDLRKLQEESLSESKLDKSWGSLYRIGGNSWKGVRSEVVELAKMQGAINNPECILKYNTSKGNDISDVPEEQELPKSDEEGSKLGVQISPKTDKEQKSQVDEGTAKDMDSSIPDGEGIAKQDHINEIKGRLEALNWLNKGVKWFLFLVPLILLGFVVFSFFYVRSRMLKMRTRLKRLDEGIIEGGFVQKAKENFEVLSKGLENITFKLNQLSSQPSAEHSYAGQFTLLQQQLQEIKNTLRGIEEENQSKKRVKENQEQELPESLEPQVKEKKYSPPPYGMEFIPEHFQSASDLDSVYKIEILEGQQRAFFSVLESPIIMEKAILEHNDRLAGVCDYVKGRPSRESRVINVEKGVLKFTGSRWLVSQKAKIDFA